MVRGIGENAFASKWGAGLGGSWSAIRGAGSKIGGTGGISEGIIPFLELHQHQLAIANQGSHRRPGAGCAHLDMWHGDVEAFIDLRKNLAAKTGVRHDPELRTCLWIPDLFMERLADRDGRWTLFQPQDVGDLLSLWGDGFSRRYAHYEGLAADGKIWSKGLSIQKIWQKILALMLETGFPRLAFGDSFNRHHAHRDGARVAASGLFGETAMAIGAEETAGSAFGTISIPAHLDAAGHWDGDRYRRTIHLAVQALDAVLDATAFPSPAMGDHCRKYRSLSLGLAGLHDFLRMRLIPLDSPAGERATDQLFETLCRESSVASDGRNGYRNAQAPTTRTARLLGVSPGSLPAVSNVTKISLPSGEKIWVLDANLVKILRHRGLWSAELGEQLAYLDGDLEAFPEIPDAIRRAHAPAFSLDPEKFLSLAATIQKNLDQSQYLPLYLRMPTFTQLSTLLQMAWKKDLKTIGPLVTSHAWIHERARAKFNP
jgi:ribonucleoside-diphosphate reductase alpha chain